MSGFASAAQSLLVLDTWFTCVTVNARRACMSMSLQQGHGPRIAAHPVSYECTQGSNERRGILVRPCWCSSNGVASLCISTVDTDAAAAVCVQVEDDLQMVQPVLSYTESVRRHQSSSGGDNAGYPQQQSGLGTLQQLRQHQVRLQAPQ